MSALTDFLTASPPRPNDGLSLSRGDDGHFEVTYGRMLLMEGWAGPRAEVVAALEAAGHAELAAAASGSDSPAVVAARSVPVNAQPEMRAAQASALRRLEAEAARTSAGATYVHAPRAGLPAWAEAEFWRQMGYAGAGGAVHRR